MSDSEHEIAEQGPDGERGTAAPGRRFRLVSKGSIVRLSVLFTVIGVGLILCWAVMINMPGSTHSGPLPPVTRQQTETAERLRSDVEVLAAEHRERHVFNPIRYAAAARFLETWLSEAGLSPTRQTFTTSAQNSSCVNIMAEIAGSTHPAEFVIVGAHYDAIDGTPGADDNASGVAVLLELAARFKAKADEGEPPARSLRFVCFANEEPPHFMTADMGSHVHAMAAADAGEDVRLMISLEMLGYYDDAPGSQRYPAPLSAFYPDTGDFVAVVGNLATTGAVRRMVGRWREHTPFPCEGAAMPSGIPGIGFSDQWSFWQAGYTAVMVTDTSFYRNPHYHLSSDRPHTLDYERMARVVDGLEDVIWAEANAD